MKRLNLAKSHCERLEIALHIKLSPALAEHILAETHSHKHEGALDFAAYASVYTAGKLPHAVGAHVRREEQDYHVEFQFMRRQMPRPPRSWKSVQRLLTALEEDPQVVTVECDAYLSYDQDSAWESAVEIPQPIPSAQEKPFFTHIEAIKLGNREGDKLRYSVQIRRTDSGDLRHWVHLSSEERFSGEVPERLLQRAAGLSRVLLRKREEAVPDGG